MFSSPPRGSLISIHENLTAELPGSSSRPLHGVLLSQFKPILFIWQTRWMFSSPPRGSLISICAPAPDLRLQTCSRPLHGVLLSQLEVFFKVVLHSCSRPLHGVLLSQYCPLHLSKHKAFIPHLRGKPANERNLNIKLVYNILKA